MFGGLEARLGPAGGEAVKPAAEILKLNPSGSVPTTVEENGLAVPDFSVICEYLDEAYPDTLLLGHTLTEQVEVRRLIAWVGRKVFAGSHALVS